MISNCIDIDFNQSLCGIDEAGRGPLIGSVVAAAVWIPPNCPENLLHRINDSKKITESKREKLAEELKSHLYFGIGKADAAEIDEINILQASLLAMVRAYDQLSHTHPDLKIELALIDGNKIPPTLSIPAQAIVKGDQKSRSIAAASILAKVARDEEMKQLARDYPEFGFEKHKGYPTQLHLEAIAKYGITPYHRKSFKGVIKKSF